MPEGKPVKRQGSQQARRGVYSRHHAQLRMHSQRRFSPATRAAQAPLLTLFLAHSCNSPVSEARAI